MNKSVSYQNYSIESLKDPEKVADYLNAALEGGDVQTCLLALYNIVHAQVGVAKSRQNNLFQ